MNNNTYPINIDELKFRMKRLRYKSFSDFQKRSGIPRTYETLRNVFQSGNVKSPETYFLILKHLKYTKEEIKERLLEIGEEGISSMLDENGGSKENIILPEHRAIIEIIEKIRIYDPDLSIIFSFFRATARALHIHIKEELKILEETPYKEKVERIGPVQSR
jgi:hypothetical protein